MSPKGLTQLREMIVRDRNHASVMAYSIGNELGDPEAGLEDYIRRAARLARAADPAAWWHSTSVSRRPARARVFGELDALGVNEYFGWTYSAVEGSAPISMC